MCAIMPFARESNSPAKFSRRARASLAEQIRMVFYQRHRRRTSNDLISYQIDRKNLKGMDALSKTPLLALRARTSASSTLTLTVLALSQWLPRPHPYSRLLPSPVAIWSHNFGKSMSSQGSLVFSDLLVRRWTVWTWMKSFEETWWGRSVTRTFPGCVLAAPPKGRVEDVEYEYLEAIRRRDWRTSETISNV